jgi:hypothetical protein
MAFTLSQGDGSVPATECARPNDPPSRARDVVCSLSVLLSVPHLRRWTTLGPRLGRLIGLTKSGVSNQHGLRKQSAVVREPRSTKFARDYASS